jgi:prolyl 4-hydroxylase
MDFSSGGLTLDPGRISGSFALTDRFPKLQQYFSVIEERMAATVMLPLSHAEPLQLQHYQAGGHYILHTDYLSPAHIRAQQGNRIATFLLYLNTVDHGAGGETVFPLADFSEGKSKFRSASPWAAGADAIEKLRAVCAHEQVLKASPVRGDALLFYPSLPNGTEDAKAAHGSCPVLEGEKWVAQLWFHDGRVRNLI